MSLNQILSPSGTGLNLDVHSVKSFTSLPKYVTSPYNITLDDLVKQRMLMVANDSTAVTFTFPSVTQLNTILPNIGDYLELTVKYRTFQNPLINSVDNILYIMFGASYSLQASDGVNFKTQKIGISRYTTGSYRIY